MRTSPLGGFHLIRASSDSAARGAAELDEYGRPPNGDRTPRPEAGGDAELTFEPPLHLVTTDGRLTLRIEVDGERLVQQVPMSYRGVAHR
jgi:hypothetical protein